MKDNNLPAVRQKTFEELKKVNQYGAEYWSARELQPMLGYTQWRRFEDAVNRAKTSCRQSGNAPDYHFAGAGKVIFRQLPFAVFIQHYRFARVRKVMPRVIA